LAAQIFKIFELGEIRKKLRRSIDVFGRNALNFVRFEKERRLFLLSGRFPVKYSVHIMQSYADPRLDALPAKFAQHLFN
jgi:hypothetical protein